MSTEIQNATFYLRKNPDDQIHCYASGPVNEKGSRGYGSSYATGTNEMKVVINLINPNDAFRNHTFGETLKIANGPGGILCYNNRDRPLPPESFAKIQQMIATTLINTRIELRTAPHESAIVLRHFGF